jgi:hypothetical protein
MNQVLREALVGNAWEIRDLREVHGRCPLLVWLEKHGQTDAC